MEDIQHKISVCNHLDESAASISLNIAEGNGKYTSKDRCKFFDIARGSALECSGCLDVLVQRKCINPQKAMEGKQMLIDIVSMLVGLIKSNSERLHEPEIEYKGYSE